MKQALLACVADNGALHRVMQASSIGMAVVSLQGVWEEVNPALCRMLDYPADELVGRRIGEFTHPDDVAESERFIACLLEDRNLILDERKRYLRRDGFVMWGHINVAVLCNDDDEPVCFFTQIRDVSAEHDREEGLRASIEHSGAELEASNRQLQLFADAVAHDLRAPLRSIESFSARLAQMLDSRLDEVSRDHLDRIRAAAARMSDLLKSLGRLSHVTRAELKPERIDLSLLADWAGAELRDAGEQRDVAMRIQPGLVAQGDERLIKTLLDELIGNAWKFTRDSPQPLIEFGGEQQDGRMRLHVRDTGTGFEMRYSHKLFEPFQRLHGPEQGGGHGLGLAIAKRIAERHEGRVWAESEPGKGSTFFVELPLAPADRGAGR
jgi:PAS domain S-box-containing protein